MKKRILSLILAVLTVFSLCSAAFASDGVDKDPISMSLVPGGGAKGRDVFDSLAPASADRPATTATSGSCGANLRWSFNSSTGALTISGSGAMYDYTNSNPPWSSLNVKRIDIGEYVTSIGAWAFAGLGNLTSFNCYNNASLRSIGTCAFYNISHNLSGSWPKWTIPGTVTSLAEGALAGIKTEAYVIGTSTSQGVAASYFSVSNGVLYNKAKTKLLQYPSYKTSTYYSMPSTVTAVGNYGMLGAFDVTSISLSSNLKTIGIKGFYGCLDLTSITIPSSVTTIRQGAFAMCQSLSRITVQSNTCLIYNPTNTSDEDYRCALGVPGKTVVYARTGSTAHTYATKNGYSFQSTGTITSTTKNGLYTEGGYTYYYKNGVKQKGLVTVSKGVMYFCNPTDGHVYKNCWILVNGVKKYAAQADGRLYTGYCAIEGKNYYFSVNDGHIMKGGLVTGPGGYQYYVSAKDGHAMKNGWARGKQVKGTNLWNYYYLDSTGVVILAVQSRTQPNYRPV